MNAINRRLLIPIAAGLVVLIIWYVALWSPQSSSLSKAKKRTEEAIAKRDTLRTQITRLQEAQKDQPLKQAQLETMRVAIPDDPNLAQFILDANDAASKAGIDFLSITPTPPGQSAAAAPTPGAAGSAALTPIKIGMSVSGGYFQVLNFINLLNTLPRIVVVDNLSMAGTSGSNSTATTGAGAATTASSVVTLQVALQERIFTTSQQQVSNAAGGSGGATTTTVAGGATTTTAPGTTATTTAGVTATTAR